MRLFILLMLIATTAQAGISGLSWQPPTQRQDNSVMSVDEIGGFRVYDAELMQIGADIPPDQRSITLDKIYMGKVIYVTCFDTDGRESNYSAAILVPSLPKAPSVTVTYTISTELPGTE